MIDTWNPAKLNEKISGRDTWNPAILNETVTDRDSWNPAILNESSGETPVVFEATITASFPEGATCTATDGTTTLTADDNPMAFSIPNEGTWAVACVANGVTFSEDVVITTNGQTESVDLTPVGNTYATTDSVPVLIACAGIGDSEITTIAGALADVETLTAILESENAIDYLVRSTTFASDVTADSVAMTGIGAINYDADTLLADSTWRSAICNSTYIESVLNAEVPTMTSNTTPSGECFGTTPYASYNYFLAFDGDNNSMYYSDNGDAYVGYKFITPIKLYYVKSNKISGHAADAFNYDLYIETSNDGVTYATVSNTVTESMTSLVFKSVTFNVTPTNAQYVRLHSVTNGAGWSSQTYDLQFYGRVDV